MLLLVLTLDLTSCATRTEYKRVDIPAYPKNMEWNYDESSKLYTLPQEDLDRLIAWRTKIEEL